MVSSSGTNSHKASSLSIYLENSTIPRVLNLNSSILKHLLHNLLAIPSSSEFSRMPMESRVIQIYFLKRFKNFPQNYFVMKCIHFFFVDFRAIICIIFEAPPIHSFVISLLGLPHSNQSSRT